MLTGKASNRVFYLFKPPESPCPKDTCLRIYDWRRSQVWLFGRQMLLKLLATNSRKDLLQFLEIRRFDEVMVKTRLDCSLSV
jgi:hypothetical protein